MWSASRLHILHVRAVQRPGCHWLWEAWDGPGFHMMYVSALQ